MTKHQTVMHIVDVSKYVNRDDIRVYFSAIREEGDEPYSNETHRIQRSEWEDMGKPDTITVTVEPGDLLNPEPQIDMCE